MSKLLVIGMGPLLEEGVRHFGAQALRTWYFTKPLLDDGHSVRLVTLPISNPDEKGSVHGAALVRHSCEGFEYQGITHPNFALIHDTLNQIVRSFEPDALVGVNMVAAWVAAQLHTRAPLWADLNGYEMAEKQGQAARATDGAPLFDAWRKESIVARRADKLSTVSQAQMHALLGEMASLGRLNRLTFHYTFAHTIPNGCHESFLRAGEPALAGASGPAAAPSQNPAASPGDAAPLPARPLLRGPVVPPDAFVLLWSGGYNYWTNPAFLFEFVEACMQANPRIHYVSTGGELQGYNRSTYDDFVRRVNASPQRARYHLLGWVPAEDLPAIYREADLGINIDEPNYETFFGARNRLNNLMAAGVPVLTSYGSEISAHIDEAEAGIVCPAGDCEALVQAVVQLAASPRLLRDLARRGRQLAVEEFAPARVTLPLRQWAQSPALAPDNAEKIARHPALTRFLDATANPLEAQARIRHEHDLLALQNAANDLRAIRSKKWFRAARALRIVR